MREIQYFYLMHATKLKEDRLSLSKSDKLTSKVYLRIYYSLRTGGCYLRTALWWTFLRAYPRYMYNILRIAGTFSSFLLKILCHYLVHPEYASKNILFRDCTNDSWSCWTKKCSYFTNKISFSQTKLLAYLLFGSVIYSTRSLKGTYKFSMRIYSVGKTSELFTSSIIFHLKFHGSFGNAKVRSPFNYDSSEFEATMLHIARSISTTVLSI